MRPAGVISANELVDVDVLVTSAGETKITSESLPKSGRLALTARAGAGYDDMDILAYTSNHVAVAIASDAARRPTAVAALTLILAVATRLILKHFIALKGPEDWARSPHFLNADLTGKTLGLVGLGSIGREEASLVSPLEMRIIVHDPYAKLESAAAADAQLVSFEALLKKVDRFASRPTEQCYPASDGRPTPQSDEADCLSYQYTAGPGCRSKGAYWVS